MYRERTLDMWAEAAMLEHDVNSIFTENSNNNKKALKKGHSQPNIIQRPCLSRKWSFSSGLETM